MFMYIYIYTIFFIIHIFNYVTLRDNYLYYIFIQISLQFFNKKYSMLHEM